VTLVIAFTLASLLEALHGDVEATLRNTEILAEITTRIELPFFSSWAKICQGWARAKLGEHEAGAMMRQALEKSVQQGNRWCATYFRGLLA